MKVFALKYTTEETNITYGIFSSKKKAESAKKELVLKIDEDMKYYWTRELYITEITVDKINREID